MRSTTIRPTLLAACGTLIRHARIGIAAIGDRAFGCVAASVPVEGMFGGGGRRSSIRQCRGLGHSARDAASRRATAALEFALATPMLVVLFGGAADYGLAQFYRTNLANAVAAGCEYAYLTGNTVTASNIQVVVQNMMFLPAGAAANLSVNVTGPKGYCVTGSGPTMSAASVPSTCSDGSAAGNYVLITATYTNTGLMHGFMSTTTQPITESATIRLN
jgi:Flp pilus assembly protein TadG